MKLAKACLAVVGSVLLAVALTSSLAPKSALASAPMNVIVTNTSRNPVPVQALGPLTWFTQSYGCTWLAQEKNNENR